MEDTGRRRLTVKGPTDFTGNPEHWEAWSYKFTAYASRTDQRLETLLTRAERSLAPITDDDLDQWEMNNPTDANQISPLQLSRDVHYYLMEKCQGTAATIVRKNRLTRSDLET